MEKEWEALCRCGATIHRWYDIRRDRIVYQHGDNPEAVLLVAQADMDDDGLTVAAKVIQWTDRVHEYDARVRDEQE